ncbi:hypothetical protein F4778DRAFT_791310 [Xylariomycetidae sp. FL2044]|nr:hypothetical protein F4778DRAFT_791310 [Xylariomycetidae sp. FL2044]
MGPSRQSRQSCEACRTRKLKCTGEKTGCTRCLAVGVVCEFREQGIPGRPPKRQCTEDWRQRQQKQQQVDDREPPSGSTDSCFNLDDVLYRRDSGVQQQSQQDCCPATAAFSDSSPTAPYGSPISLPSLAYAPSTTNSQAIPTHPSPEDDAADFFALDFSTQDQLASLPLDFFGPCLHSGNSSHSRADGLQSPPPTDTATSQTTGPEPQPQLQPQASCTCAEHVFETGRSLKRRAASHSLLPVLRVGADLMQTLLVCAVCYDVTRPPRETLANVLLLARLALDVAAGYQRYLAWLRAKCRGLAARGETEPVFLLPGADAAAAGPDLGVGGDQLWALVTHGLRRDAERLAALGRQFAARQRSRHRIGHETCPGPEGRCWKDDDRGAPPADLLDICPQSATAETLTPCYRIVDDVRAKFREVAEAVS